MILMGILLQVGFIVSGCQPKAETISSPIVVQTSAGDITEEDIFQELKNSTTGQELLQQLVYIKILEDRYTVTEEDIEAKMDSMREQVGSEESFDAFLAQQGIVDEDDMKAYFKESIYLERATTEGIELSDDVLQQYYDEHIEEYTRLELQHILVEDKEKAYVLHKKLMDGEDFTTLAQAESEDEATAKSGGALGKISLQNKNISQSFIEAATKLEENDISKPVKTVFGYHIIQLTKRVVDPFEDVRDQIEQTLLQEQARPLHEVFTELNDEIEGDAFEGLFKSETK